MEWYDEKPHDIKMFYTEQEFSDAEFNAIEKAREQAILNKYGNFFLLGTGSYKMSHVYKTTSKSGSGLEEAVALKIISGITQECSSSNLEISKNQLKSKLRSNEFENSAESEIKLQYDGINRCPNVIPLDGTDLLDWICPDFKRVGVDYVLKMPLADCLSNAIAKIKSAENRIDKIIQLGIDICKALESLHAQEIYHRDIKPANIYLYNGNYCLGDFGISIHKNNLKLYEIGTEEYCAPEQHYRARTTNPWLCKKYNHRIDIYSLGLVLYELAGEKPVEQLFTQRMRGTLPDISTESEGLNKIIHTACQFDPDDRYQNATIFKENLERLQQDKNYIPSQEVHITISDQTIAENNLQQPDGDTYIGKEKDPYDDEFDPTADEEKDSDSIANSMWNVGLFWYEKSQEEASRFANFEIDKNIMPLTSIEQEQPYDFPVKFHSQGSSEEIPLSRLIANINNIKNMYLIGEGGSGKTSALYSIMQDTYKGQMYPVKYSNKITIPLFIELSKAPDVCGKAYKEGYSTFIRRYLYLLIKSAQQKTELLTENSNALRDVLGIGNDYEQDDIVNTIDHLLDEDNGIQFLLLLDGLNEVSRKTISFTESSETVAELIVDEIREIQEYKNVTIIITSRADEAVNFGNDLSKYYLSGIDDTTIKQYLKDNKVSDCNLEQNPRLLTTLRNPFFLKLYCRLIFKSGISSPGEILYNFFKERTSMYSLRNRINTINSEQSITGSRHVYNRITEKMQWFILDFILPEIGWYMEKNSLYSIDLPTIKSVITPILAGTKDTDVCGQYGIAFFKDYHKGTDGSKNTRSYAKYLMELTSPHQTYIEAIVEYCIYSLGILYVNNQNYGFMHQHIRDFFAAIKIITNMKLALYISKCDNASKNPIQNLSVINKDILSNTVIQYVGEILHEHLQSIENQNTSLLQNVLSLYRNIFFPKYAEEYGVWNLIKILYVSHKTLSGMDLSYLDLRNCPLNDINLSHSDLTGSAVTHDTLFETVHTDGIQSIAYSANGYLLYTGGRDGSLKIWHVETSKCLKTIKKYHDSIMNISLNKNYLAVSTGKITEIIDINTYKVCRRYRAINGVFSPSGELLVVFYKRKKTQVINATSFKIIGHLGYSYNPLISDSNMITFTSNSKYIAYTVSSRYNIFSEKSIEIWNLETFTKVFTICNEDDPYERISGIDFNQEGNSIVVAMYRSSINIYQLHLKNKSYSFHCRFSLKREYGGTEINQVATSVKYVASTCLIIGDRDGGLHIYNLNYVNQPLSKQFHFYKKAHTYTISCVSIHFNKSQLYLAAGDTDGCIKIWDLNRKNVVKDLQNCNDKRILCSYYIKSTHEILMCSKKDILVFNLETGILSNNIFVSNIHHTAYEDNSKLFAIAYLNNILNIYHYSEKFHFIDKIIVPCEKIEYIQFVANGKYLVINGDNKYFFKYDTQSNILKRLRFSLSQEGRKKKLISISGNAIIYATYPHNGKIKAYDIINEKRFPAIKINLEKTPFKGVNDEHKIMLLGNVVCFSYQKSNYLTMKGGQVYKLNEYNHEYNLYLTNKGFNPPELFLSNDAKFLAVVTSDLYPEVQIYSVQTEEHLFDIYNLPRINKISSPISLRHILSYIAYNKVYYTNSKDFRLTLSSFVSDDIENFLCSIKQHLQFLFYKKYNGHQNGCVSSVSFVPFSEIFITSSFDGTIKIWKPTKCKKFPKTLTCFKTIKYIPGLKVKDAKIQKLSLLSDLSIEDIRDLKNYGAQLD